MTRTSKTAKSAPKRKPRAKPAPRPAVKAEMLPAVIADNGKPADEVLSPEEYQIAQQLSVDKSPEPVDTKPARKIKTEPAKLRQLISVMGLSFANAGKVLGVSHNAVFQACQRHGIPRKAELDQYKRQRADIIAAKQLQVLSGVDEDSLKGCSAYQRVGMFGILYDKERLERGQSTQNVGQQIEYLSDKTADKLDRLLNDGSGN